MQLCTSSLHKTKRHSALLSPCLMSRFRFALSCEGARVVHSLQLQIFFYSANRDAAPNHSCRFVQAAAITVSMHTGAPTAHMCVQGMCRGGRCAPVFGGHNLRLQGQRVRFSIYDIEKISPDDDLACVMLMQHVGSRDARAEDASMCEA